APTPERLKKPDMDGSELRASVSITEGNTVTTWRISPSLNGLLQRRTITNQEFQAAQRFLRDYFLGMYAGPASARYAERTGPSHSDVDRETRLVHHAREVQKAMRAVDQIYQPALAWLIASLGEAPPLQ